MACLFWGEAVAVGLWLLMRRFRNLDRIIKGFGKDITKEFGDASAREAFAYDVLEAGDEWKFRDDGNRKTFLNLLRKRLGEQIEIVQSS